MSPRAEQTTRPATRPIRQPLLTVAPGVDMRPLLGKLARLRDHLRVDGAAGTVRILLARRATEATFIWKALDLADPYHRRPELDAGLVLRRGSLEDAPLLEQLPVDLRVTRVTRSVLEDRLGQGASLWLVQAGERIAFHCWTFRSRFPLHGIRGDTLALPADVVIVEDVIASPDFRRQGVAAAALAAVGDACREEGARWLVMKVDSENTASRRAFDKMGYAEVAQMHVVRRNWHTRLRLGRPPGEPAHRWLLQINGG